MMVDDTEMQAGEVEVAEAPAAETPQVNEPAAVVEAEVVEAEEAPTFTQSRSSQAAKPVEDPDNLSLEAQPRLVSGRRVGQIRLQGLTPAVLYGKGMEPMSLQVNTKTFMHVAGMAGGEKPIQLMVEGESGGRSVRIHAVQRHVTRLSPTHIDFIAV